MKDKIKADESTQVKIKEKHGEKLNLLTWI